MGFGVLDAGFGIPHRRGIPPSTLVPPVETLELLELHLAVRTKSLTTVDGRNPA